jgi:hypothetical protein
MPEITLERARAAKTKAARAVRSATRVLGVGLTRVGSSYAVKVNLPAPPADPACLPRTVDDVPVIYDIVGAIRAR